MSVAMTRAVASVFRDGMVRVDTKLLEGALPLCSGEIDEVVRAITRHCNLCYDGQSYKLGEIVLEDDDEKAMQIVASISRKITEELAWERKAMADADSRWA